jgi:hypothetical protein
MNVAGAAPGAQLHQLHLDEEDCLGLELFVAELELVLGPKDRRPDQTQLLELLQKLQLSVAAAEPAAVKRAQRRCEGALADLLHRGLCPVVRAAPGRGRRRRWRAGRAPRGRGRCRRDAVAAAPRQQPCRARAQRRRALCARPGPQHPPNTPPRQVRALACGCMSRLYSAGDMLPLYGRVSALQGELQERERAGGEVRRGGGRRRRRALRRRRRALRRGLCSGGRCCATGACMQA